MSGRRIGINVGDIVVEDGDIFGDGVNVAVRLEGLSEPGGSIAQLALPGSLLTLCWREGDSNLRFLVARPAKLPWEAGLLSRKRERICWGTERRYGAGGEEMATSSLYLIDGVPAMPQPNDPGFRQGRP
jgi:hypothetical protein